MNLSPMKLPVILLGALCLCVSSLSQARAHAVYVDAWVDGAMMCAEGSFGGKTKTKNSAVTVMDAQGNLLHEGVTDEEGKVCFPLPEKPAKLTFVLNAGEGHRAETNLYEEDFPPGEVSPASSAQSPSFAVPEPVPAGGAGLDAVVREAVRQEMRQQLGPIRQSLAALQAREPGMLEIFGGIGWIVGLAGAAALASCRRRQK